MVDLSPDFQAVLDRLRDESDAANERTSRESNQNRDQWLATTEADLARRRTPDEAGTPAGDTLLAQIEEMVRQELGALPWVQTAMGKVLSVNRTAGTCRVSVARDALGGGGQQQKISYGLTAPTVGNTYPVHFPMVAPRTPQPLTRGPQADPAHLPWLKAFGGQTWIYYGARIPAGGFGWYRVPLPPASGVYADTDALLVAVRGARPPDYLNWGGSNLTGVAPTYSTRHLWMEDCGWPNNRDALYGVFGTVRPWRTMLRHYPEWGADPTLPAGQDGGGLLTSYPWLHLTGTNLDQSADADYFLGAQYAVEPLTLPDDNPTFRTARMSNIRITLASSIGGTNWNVASSALLYGQKTKITYDDTNGYHAGFFNYVQGEMADACGWTADTTSTWGIAGQRISYWAVQQLTPDPFPNELELIPLSRPNLITDRYNLCPSRIHVFVAQDGGTASEMPLPNQPAGWVNAYPGFFLRPTGGGRARAWWLGMPSFIQHRIAAPEFTPIRLWRGELDLVNGTADWTLATGPALNRLLAVNQDASVVLASVLTPAGVDPDGSDIIYLTQDAGATWTLLPQLPYAVNWGHDPLTARLIDTP